jgi:MHS family proline/betaine transporter-like MFS transporter
VFRHYKAPLAKVISISLVQNIGTYVGTVFVAVYFSNVLGFSKGAASTIVLVAVLLAAALIPLAGLLGNRIGGKRLLVWSYLAYIVITIPTFMLMNQHSVGLAMLGLAIGMIPYALCQAGTYATMPEFFQVEVRHTGVAFSHSTGAVIGGLCPYLATFLIAQTSNNYIPGYMMVLAGVVGFVVIAITTRKLPATAGHLYK